MATIKLVVVFACVGVALVLGAEGGEAGGENASLEIERALAALQAMLSAKVDNNTVDETGGKPGNKAADRQGDKPGDTSAAPPALWPQLAEAHLVKLTAALHHQVEETKKAVLSALHHTQQQVAASAEQFRAAHPELEQHLQAAVSRAAELSAAVARLRDTLALPAWGGAATEGHTGHR